MKIFYAVFSLYKVKKCPKKFVKNNKKYGFIEIKTENIFIIRYAQIVFNFRKITPWIITRKECCKVEIEVILMIHFCLFPQHFTNSLLGLVENFYYRGILFFFPLVKLGLVKLAFLRYKTWEVRWANREPFFHLFLKTMGV